MKIATNTTLLSLVALSSLGFLVSPVSAECKVGTHPIRTYTSYNSCHYGCVYGNCDGAVCCEADQCRAGTHVTATYTDYTSCHDGCTVGDCNPKPEMLKEGDEIKCCEVNVDWSKPHDRPLGPTLYGKESNIEKVLKEMNEELDYIDAKLNNNK